MKYYRNSDIKIGAYGRSLLLTLTLSLSPLAVSAQKITLGSCITRDGGQYKGEMVSGKPQGKGAAVYSNGDTYEALTSRASVRGMVSTPSPMARSMRDSGCKTNSTAREPTISRTIINMWDSGFATSSMAMA